MIDTFFMYGTLKKGYRNHSFLQGSTYQGTYTIDGYKLYGVEINKKIVYPIAVRGQGTITGEVWKPTLESAVYITEMEVLAGYSIDVVKIQEKKYSLMFVEGEIHKQIRNKSIESYAKIIPIDTF